MQSSNQRFVNDAVDLSNSTHNGDEIHFHQLARLANCSIYIAQLFCQRDETVFNEIDLIIMLIHFTFKVKIAYSY